jgi:prepilin-type N-terminal cleavage/methylation domain-containing protein
MIKQTKKISLDKQSGYSLVELIVAIVLIGIIAGVLAKMFIWGVDIFDTVSNRKDIVQSSRISMEVISKDLRMIKSENDIVSASTTGLNFYNMDNEHIIYNFGDGTISRNANSMVEGITSFVFTYYDANGTILVSPVADPTDIWKIKVELDATVDGKPINLETIVTPRNLNED